MRNLASIALTLLLSSPAPAIAPLAWQGEDPLRWVVEKMPDDARRLHVDFRQDGESVLHVIYVYDDQGAMQGKIFERQNVFPQTWTGKLLAAPRGDSKDDGQREAALVYDNAVPLTMERLVPSVTDKDDVLQQIRGYFVNPVGPTENPERDHFLLLRSVADLIHYRTAFVEEQLSTGVPRPDERVPLARVGDRYAVLDAALVEKLGLTESPRGVPGDLPQAIARLEEHLAKQFATYLALEDRGMLMFSMPLQEEPEAVLRFERLFGRLAHRNPGLARELATLLRDGHFYLFNDDRNESFGRCAIDYGGPENLPILFRTPFVLLPEPELEKSIRRQFDDVLTPGDRQMGQFMAASRIPYSLFVLAHEVGHYWSVRGFRSAERGQMWQRRVYQQQTKRAFMDMFVASQIPEAYASSGALDPDVAAIVKTWAHRVVDSRGSIHVLIDSRTKALFRHFNQPPREGLFFNWVHEAMADGERSWVPASEMLAHAYAIDQLAGFFFIADAPP